MNFTMDSFKEVLPSVSRPALPSVTQKCGTTSFQKKLFHYKWLVKDAKGALTFGKYIQSPKFTIPEIPVHLSLYMSWTGSGHYRSLSIIFHGELDTKSRKTVLEVTVANFCCSLINISDNANKDFCQNEEQKFIWNDSIYKLEIKKNFDLHDLKKLLHDNSLTVHFSGTFFLWSKPIHSIHDVPTSIDPSSQILKKMHEKKLFSDAQIEVKNKVFDVHRAVLASRSGVFHKMFETNMQEKEKKKVKVTDLEPEIMSDIITYIYTGNAPQLKSHTKDLLLAAEKYDIPDLVRLCTDELKGNLTPNNVASILILSNSLEMTSSRALKEACMYFIRKNSAQVYRSDSWKELKESSSELAVEVAEAMLGALSA